MNVLGIETSCDETSASVVLNGRKVMSCVVASQIKDHKPFGGVVPEIASRKHIENISEITKSAVLKADLKLKDLDLIAVTNTPGLVGCLLVGINFAKGLSFSLKKPLVAVNHLKAHVAANYITNKNLTPPFLALIISGGHTNLVNVKTYVDYELIGKSVDDSIGETYDKIGRVLGLSYPAGAEIDRLSKFGDRFKFSFPKPKVENLNFSFSGLKTAVIKKIKEEKTFKIEDFAASFQETICEIVKDKVFSALRKTKQKRLVVCGGVAANSDIRRILNEKAKETNIEIFMPSLNYCTDNAAMVSSQGFFEFENQNFEKDYKLNAFSKNVF